MFNPLGSFSTESPLLEEALNKAEKFLTELPGPLGIKLNRLYLHWAVEPFGCLDGAYNAEVDLEFLENPEDRNAEKQWVLKITHDPRDNGIGDPNTEAAHTWHRNSYAVGLAITGMDGATEQNFGPDGVQFHEIEHLCAAAAAICVRYGIDSQGLVTDGVVHLDNNNNPVNTHGEKNILTHGEVAVIDAYPSERWDLGSLVPLPNGVSLTSDMRTQVGDALRLRIHQYAIELRKDKINAGK